MAKGIFIPEKYIDQLVTLLYDLQSYGYNGCSTYDQETANEAGDMIAEITCATVYDISDEELEKYEIVE